MVGVVLCHDYQHWWLVRYYVLTTNIDGWCSVMIRLLTLVVGVVLYFDYQHWWWEWCYVLTTNIGGWSGVMS